jgi:hypothetical protein
MAARAIPLPPIFLCDAMEWVGDQVERMRERRKPLGADERSEARRDKHMQRIHTVAEPHWDSEWGEPGQA